MDGPVQIVGGPRDGEFVPYVGAIFRAPRKRARVLIRDEPPWPDGGKYVVEEYDLQWWWTGSQRVPRYVLRDMKKSLGY